MYPIRWPLAEAVGRLGIPLVIKIRVLFDAEANVFVGTSPDVPGLVVEADSLDDVMREARELIPCLLNAEHKRVISPVSTKLSFTNPLTC
ncbi:MAG: DUF1902 domain-containing protein [Bradyrhizobium sp.]|nr:DUF1902 domain-containing protein [Bradyrhizobium sp.]